MSASVRVCAFAALVAALAGCSEERFISDHADGPWFVSRFGGEGDWRLESESEIAVQDRPGMLLYERTRYPVEPPTHAQEEAARGLREACFLAAAQHDWFDFRRGHDDGYTLLVGDEAHYVNEDYMSDDVLLDPQRPEFLMYYDAPRGGKALVGFMFYVRQPEERGPQIGGALTVWHYHVWSLARCFDGVVPTGLMEREGVCARGAPVHRSPEMLHVWLLDHPEGPFATRMRIHPEVLGDLLEQRGY